VECGLCKLTLCTGVAVSVCELFLFYLRVGLLCIQFPRLIRAAKLDRWRETGREASLLL
jgi:hypothetical protein